jgi:EmrB/QacA subfamily drug resistance transporter
MATPRARSSNLLVLIIVCFADFMVVLDLTIVNVALPAIQRDLALSATDLQWVVNAYTLLFAGFLLLGGSAADRFGRRRMFVIGLSLFTAASLADALATSSGALIAARAAQGLGGALLAPATLSIITTTFEEGPERTRALAIWGAIGGGGGSVGVLLGGVLTDQLSWPWIFAINIPIGIAVLLAALRFVPATRPEASRTGFDVIGAVLVTTGLATLTFAIVKSPDYGWGDTRVLVLTAVALGLLGAFLAWQRRVADPLLRLSIFRNRSVTTSNLSLMFLVGGMFPMMYFTALYLQEVKGYDALESGIAFLPETIGILIGSMLAQRLIARFGMRSVIVGGLITATVGMLWLTRLTPTASYAFGVLPGLTLVALGSGNVFVPITIAATTVEDEDQGLASGIFNVSQWIGAAISLALMTAVAASVTGSTISHAHLVDGYQAAFAIGTGSIVLSLLTVVLLPGISGSRGTDAPDTVGVASG